MNNRNGVIDFRNLHDSVVCLMYSDAVLGCNKYSRNSTTGYGGYFVVVDAATDRYLVIFLLGIDRRKSRKPLMLIMFLNEMRDARCESN